LTIVAFNTALTTLIQVIIFVDKPACQLKENSSIDWVYLWLTRENQAFVAHWLDLFLLVLLFNGESPEVINYDSLASFKPYLGHELSQTVDFDDFLNLKLFM
jgi:hypothetical protein